MYGVDAGHSQTKQARDRASKPQSAEAGHVGVEVLLVTTSRHLHVRNKPERTARPDSAPTGPDRSRPLWAALSLSPTNCDWGHEGGRSGPEHTPPYMTWTAGQVPRYRGQALPTPSNPPLAPRLRSHRPAARTSDQSWASGPWPVRPSASLHQSTRPSSLQRPARRGTCTRMAMYPGCCAARFENGSSSPPESLKPPGHPSSSLPPDQPANLCQIFSCKTFLFFPHSTFFLVSQEARYYRTNGIDLFLGAATNITFWDPRLAPAHPLRLFIFFHSSSHPFFFAATAFSSRHTQAKTQVARIPSHRCVLRAS